MTPNEIQAIIRQINESDIREVELNYQDVHLYLNKNQTSHRAEVNQTKDEVAEPQNEVETVSSSEVTVPQQNGDTDTGVAIKAPLVGVIYLQPSPDKPAYKQVGDSVEAGDVVCVIEAMKMMTEIKSDVSGTISEILVENEEVVEFDQPLFKVIK